MCTYTPKVPEIPKPVIQPPAEEARIQIGSGRLDEQKELLKRKRTGINTIAGSNITGTVLNIPS